MIATEYAECDMRLLWIQYLTPQQLHPLSCLAANSTQWCSFFPKDIQGDTDVGEFDAIHMLR